MQLWAEALPAPLFQRLRRAVVQLGSEGLRRTYQTTFWFNLREPACLPEQAALALRPRVPPGRPVVGVEWWLSRMRTTDVRVDFHRDRDERLALRTGRQVPPVWSSVLFLNRCRGGLLALCDEAPDETQPSHAPLGREWDLIKPRPNRFVLFPGDRTHGVLDARNQVPRGRLPGSPPLRLTLVLNWWHRRPEAVPAWREARPYRSLKS